MTQSTCPSCHGTGDVPGHLQPNTVGAPRGMGSVRCNRCGGTGVIYGAPGSAVGGGANVFSGGGAHPVIWIFGIFFALVFANAKLFGLNWVVSGFIGLCFGSVIGGVLLATKYGRYILWALGAGFVVLVIIALATR